MQHWLHQYREEGEAAFEKKKYKDLRGRRPKRENTEAYIARLEMEVDLLKISCRIVQGRARQAQYRLICHQKGKYQVKAMCSFFGISRAAYYAWVKRLEWPDPDVERMEQVQYAYETSHRTYGYRRITLWLRKQPGVSINHKAVLRLMRKLNIRSVARKRRIFRERAEIHHHPDLAIAGIMLLWNVSSPI